MTSRPSIDTLQERCSALSFFFFFAVTRACTQALLDQLGLEELLKLLGVDTATLCQRLALVDPATKVPPHTHTHQGQHVDNMLRGQHVDSIDNMLTAC